MFGNVTALVGWIYVGEILGQKHAAHMLEACGLGSSQGGLVFRGDFTCLDFRRLQTQAPTFSGGVARNSVRCQVPRLLPTAVSGTLRGGVGQMWVRFAG